MVQMRRIGPVGHASWVVVIGLRVAGRSGGTLSRAYNHVPVRIVKSSWLHASRIEV